MRTLLRQALFALANISGVAILCLIVAWSYTDSALPFFAFATHFIQQIMLLDLGLTAEGKKISYEVLSRLPATIELWFSAVLLAFLIGIPLGVTAATRPKKWQDRFVEIFSLAGFSLPVFWLGLLLVLWFSIELGITPVSERIGFLYEIPSVSGFILLDSLLTFERYGFSAFFNALLHLSLPVFILAVLPTAIVTRVTKTALRNVLNTDYIRMAKGQGVSRRSIIWKHGMANVAGPVLQILTLQLSSLFTGVFLVEYIFAWPGVTAWLLDRIHVADYHAVIMGGFFVGCFLMLMNSLMDGISHFANPRARRSR